MSKSVLFLALLAVVLLFAGPVRADNLSLVTLALPPYGYVDKGKSMGIAYEWGNAIVREAGFEPRNMLVQLTRGVLEMETGGTDLIIMLPNPAMDKVAVSIGTVAPTENVVIGRAGSVLRSLKDVKGKVLARVRGAKYPKKAELEDGIIVHGTESYEQSLKLLMAKRVDFVVGPRLGLHHTARLMRLPARSLGDPLVISSVPSLLYCSKRTVSPDTRRKLAEALARLRENGTIRSIVEKYSL